MTDDPGWNADGLLAHRHRRRLLYCLFFDENPMRLPDVADRLTDWEAAVDDYNQERFRIYDDLYFDHLPPLSDAGLVEYDQEGDTVALGPGAERLRPDIEREFAEEIAALVDTDGSPVDSEEWPA